MMPSHIVSDIACLSKFWTITGVASESGSGPDRSANAASLMALRGTGGARTISAAHRLISRSNFEAAVYASLW